MNPPGSATTPEPCPKLTEALTCFAIAAPGLELLVTSELRALGYDAHPEPGGGGARWTGDLKSVERANLWLRTASRVVVRAAEFRARSFFELERHARKIPWERFSRPGAPVTFRVTCRKSRLYHSDAVAQRLGEAIERRLGAASRFAVSDADEDSEVPTVPAQQFIVRVVKDVCTVSADTSGELLHRRGYRQAVGRAPLRETLAAAMLIGSGWTGDTPLLDPLCGSGTIPIEGAMIARRMAPGLQRTFAFMDWQEFDREEWSGLHDEARAAVLPRSSVSIQGSDRDAGAIVSALSNAERAGVASDIEFVERAISDIHPPAGPGLLATNPPYGVRVGETAALRDLYAQFGHTARARCPGWSLALLSADRRLEAQMRIALSPEFQTSNGGIPVALMRGEIQA